MKIVVNFTKIIYGNNTQRLPQDELFKKVCFPRKDDYFEVMAATWMHIIIYNNEPKMINDYIRHPTHQAAFKVSRKN